MSVKNSLIAFFLVAVTLGACKKEKPEVKEVNTSAVPSVINDMPAFSITKTDSTKIFLKDLKGKVVLVLFSPDCDHCQREGKLISENKAVFDGYQLYFVSSDNNQNNAKFAKEYDLIDPNIHFAHAEGMDVYNAVGAINTVPTFFIYRDQKLISRNEGEVSIPTLSRLLN